MNRTIISEILHIMGNIINVPLWIEQLHLNEK